MTAPLATDTRRIGVICPSWVGDTVMATPALRAIREHCPEAVITAIVRPGLAPLLDGLPFVDETHAFPTRTLTGARAAAKALRHAKTDAVVLFPNSFRTGLLAWLSRASTRLGYRRDGRGMLLSQSKEVVKHATPTSAVIYYAELAAWATGRDIDHRLELAVSAAESEHADRLLAERPSGNATRRIILLNPGANRVDKRWPADRFAAAARAIADEHDLDIAVTGAPREHDLVKEVVDAVPGGAMDLVERGVTLGSLKAVAQRAALMISNDTGPRHIAAAVGTPTIALFGPTDHRWTTLTGAHEHILVSHPFLPEEGIADKNPAACAIDRIPVADVVAAGHRLLTQ